MSITLTADTVTVALLEIALFGLVVRALNRDGKLPLSGCRQWIWGRRKARLVPVTPTATTEAPSAQAVAEAHLKATPTIKRAELTMGLVTGGYATVVGASYAILDTAHGLQGGQATLMALNTLMLGYLFFFSGWWRNAVLIPLNQRIRQD